MPWNPETTVGEQRAIGYQSDPLCSVHGGDWGASFIDLKTGTLPGRVRLFAGDLLPDHPPLSRFGLAAYRLDREA